MTQKPEELDVDPKLKPDALDLLASILSDFGTRPKKELAKKPGLTNTPFAPAPKSIAKQIALLRTRQAVWAPIGRAVFIRTQECKCCGETTDFIENEFYLLEGGKSQSRWFRQEAHMPELDCDNLPIEIHRNPETLPVTVCAKCISDQPTNQLLDLVMSPQLCLEFPDE